MMERSIDELLSGEPAAEEQQEVVQAQEPEPQGDGTPRDEHGRFAPKQTGVEEEPQDEQPAEPEAGPPPADQLPKDIYEPLKAVRNENKELKQKLEMLEQQFMRQQPQPQPEQEVDFWDNPDVAMQSRLEKFGEQIIQRFKQQQQLERIDASEAAARAKYADYGDAFGAFQKAAMANPALVQEMTAASDPAEFAYTKGKSALELERYGSVDELLKAERAKWEAEARAAIPQPGGIRFPSTTATDGSVGARTGPEWAGPKPIDQLLG